MVDGIIALDSKVDTNSLIKDMSRTIKPLIMNKNCPANVKASESTIILIAFIVIGLFDFRIGLIATVCMFAPIVVSFFKGRFWCGNLCPKGNFYDSLISKFSNKKKVPKFLKLSYFRIIVTVFMLTMFATSIVKN